MTRFEPPLARLTALVALVVVLAACGPSGNDASTTTAATDPSTTTTSSTIPAPATTTTEPGPAPDVQTEIDWFVSLLNGTEVSEEEYVSRFTDEFRQRVPYEEGFLPVLEQFRPHGPFIVVERNADGSSGDVTIEAADGTQSIVVAEIDDQSRFSTLLIQPDTPTLEDPPGSVAEAFDRLGEIGTVRALAAEVVDGQCQEVDAVSSAEAAPIGSVFKLYVLAALGEEVLAGEIAWDDRIVIQDELKSVPSGTLQDRDAGETVTVRKAAELMISISDNTATDHLIDLLGRDTVESTLTDYGNTAPELNTPLLSTREFTALKVGPASGLRIQWIEGDEAARRSILDQISAITTGDLPVQEWTEPIAPDALEWFASPNDLCTLAIRLDGLAGSVPEVGEILAINPGVPAAPGTWEDLWFKGGSEPGLAATWFVTRTEGRMFVTAGSVVDAEAVIDTEEAILLFAAARDLLAP